MHQTDKNNNPNNILRLDSVTFTYPTEVTSAICDINLDINSGEFITICGKSGCGKTTLLRNLKPTLAPHGNMTGKIYFKGKDISSLSHLEQSSQIGFVLQDPDAQIATDKVWHELAFGLESLGVPTPEIRERVAEMASFFGIQSWFHKSVTELSGGQKQLLNLASIIVMQPLLLILDEPTSQLDPIAAQEFLNTISRINKELGITVILTEHRLEDAFALSDKVIVLENGKIIAEGTPSAVGKELKQAGNDMFLAFPAAMQVSSAVDSNCEFPVTVRDGRRWLKQFSNTNVITSVSEPANLYVPENVAPAIELKNIFFRYDKALPDVISGLSAKIYPGEIYAVLGGNGSGKTTLLSLIGGLLKPQRGKIIINSLSADDTSNLVGFLPQNPQTIFFAKTVRQDLYNALDAFNLSQTEKNNRLDKISSLCGITPLLDKHPYDLSGGEQQRAALCKILVTNPKILLLDEPTKGIDAHFKNTLADILINLRNEGITIILVSHDIEFCARYASRCAMVFDGLIVSENTPRKFFSGKNFYTTAANRMARGIIGDAVLAEDIIRACGKDIPKEPKSTPFDAPKPTNQTSTISEQGPPKKANIKKSFLSLIFALILIPLTVFAGVYFLGDRKYYFISLLILLETLIPFALRFERRNPRARELVIIGILCAVCTGGRVAFYMIPQFKPTLALILIAGAAFGGETGFLVGAVTGFVSNFFFGQGPWTPWHMITYGMIGYLAGVFFYNGLLQKTKYNMCIFGALSAIIVHGCIMNLGSAIALQPSLTLETLKASYILGLPFDLILSAATFIFLWIGAMPMLDKLERAKIKYGLVK